MKSKYESDIANKLQGIAMTISYSDGPFKHALEEAAQCLDSRNTWIDGNMVKNARGAKRKLTFKEKLAWWLFHSIPRKAT